LFGEYWCAWKGVGAGVGLDLTSVKTSSFSPIEKNQCAKTASNVDGFVLRTENLKDPVKYGNYSNKTDVTQISL